MRFEVGIKSCNLPSSPKYHIEKKKNCLTIIYICFYFIISCILPLLGKRNLTNIKIVQHMKFNFLMDFLSQKY